MEHGTLTILGAKLETDDVDWDDVAHADTDLGHVWFARVGGLWEWGLTYDTRSPTDFSSLNSDVGAPSLEAAVHLADHTLQLLVKRCRKIEYRPPTAEAQRPGA